MTAWRPFCFRQTCQNLARTTCHQLTNWNAKFMWWTWEQPEQWDGNRRFIFLLPLPAIYNINRDWYCYSTTKIMKIFLQYLWSNVETQTCFGRRFSPTEKLLFAWREAATKNTSAFPGYFWRGSFKAPKCLIGLLNLVTDLDYGRIYLTEHVEVFSSIFLGNIRKPRIIRKNEFRLKINFE